MMFSLGATRSGHVTGSFFAPREDPAGTSPDRDPEPRSSYPATEMMPGVRSFVACTLDLLVLPSPPPLPLAQTVSTPARASASCDLKIDGSFAPHEQLTTRTGGQTDAGTFAPHGCA